MLSLDSGSAIKIFYLSLSSLSRSGLFWNYSSYLHLLFCQFIFSKQLLSNTYLKKSKKIWKISKIQIIFLSWKFSKIQQNSKKFLKLFFEKSCMRQSWTKSFFSLISALVCLVSVFYQMKVHVLWLLWARWSLHDFYFYISRHTKINGTFLHALSSRGVKINCSSIICFFSRVLRFLKWLLRFFLRSRP